MNDSTDYLIWYGSVESAKQYLQQRKAALENPVPKASSASEEDERFGEYSQFIHMEGGTAIVSINGPLEHKESWWSKVFGLMTYETIANISAMLAGDEGVENVLLDIDSPGGMAKGIEVASDAIHALRGAGKPVHTHVSGAMMSAAYWIGSAAETVMASKYAEVGSVGVIAVHRDLTKFHDEVGVKYTVLRKGEEKALATPYEKLSDKGREQIERSMERSYTAFIDTVADNRGIPAGFVREKIATGREFSAQEAIDLGLVDEIISFNEAASRLVAASSKSQETNNWSEAAMSKKPILKAGSTSVSAEEAATAIAAGLDPTELEAPGNLSASAETEEEEESTSEEEESSETEEEEEESAEVTVSEPTAQQDSSITKLLSDLNKQLVDAKVQLDRANTSIAELTSANAGFRVIVIEQTQRMRIGLNQSSSVDDLERMSDQALVAAHQQVRDSFLERFRVGATSRVPDKDVNPPKQVVTRLDRAVQKATHLR